MFVQTNSVRAVKEYMKNRLIEHFSESEIRSITNTAICERLKIDYSDLISANDQLLSESDLLYFRGIVKRLLLNEPFQYILGETEFYGLTIKCDKRALIPRPETEELVDWALITIREMKGETEVLKIVDLGTGSGCIPISIKKYIPLADISAIDISKEALNTAKQNAEINNTEIKFLEDDILNPINQELINNQYDLIISNPPYVTDSEKLEMHQNVLNHEPHSALFVPDNEALKFYIAIADFAFNHLNKNGFLFLEINENFGKETGELLTKQGFKSVEIRQDMYGKDRMIKASL